MPGIIRKAARCVEFAFYYAIEVVWSNFRVAHDVLTPTHKMRPALIEVDASGLSGRQTPALANLVTMTPGTLTLDFSEESGVMLIHSMYVDDLEKEVEEIEMNYKERARDVF